MPRPPFGDDELEDVSERDVQLVNDDDAAPTTPRWRVIVDGVRAFPDSLVFDGPIVVGSGPSCDVILDHPSVSGRHIRLVPTGTRLAVERPPAEENAGFRVGGKDYLDEALAKHGDAVLIGSARLSVMLIDKDAR